MTAARRPPTTVRDVLARDPDQRIAPPGKVKGTGAPAPRFVEDLVEERLLRKRADQEGALRRLHAEHLAALGELCDLDADWLSAARDGARFARAYPFLPVTLPLAEALLWELRGPSPPGAERRLMEVAQGALQKLADRPLGAIVPLDLIFDGLREELLAAERPGAAGVKLIDEADRRLPGAPASPSRVLKALSLMSLVEHLRLPQTPDYYSTPAVMARLLATSLDADLPALRSEIAATLEQLQESGLVEHDEASGRYELLSAAEGRLESDINDTIACRDADVPEREGRNITQLPEERHADDAERRQPPDAQQPAEPVIRRVDTRHPDEAPFIKRPRPIPAQPGEEALSGAHEPEPEIKPPAPGRGLRWLAALGLRRGRRRFIWPAALGLLVVLAVGAVVVWKVTDGGAPRRAQRSGTTADLAATEGRATWSARSSGTTEWLSAVTFNHATDFGGALHHWAVGGSGAILASKDGGATWRAQRSGTSEMLFGVVFPDSIQGWAVGGNGAILATTDDGATWQKQRSGSTADLYGVAFYAPIFGWAVGERGAILATTNGGATWRAQRSGSDASLNGVAFIASPNNSYMGGEGATHGWAVGEGGAILATTDRGATWQKQRSGTTAWLTAVAFTDETHGWAVGAGGTILATADGGATWSAQRAGIGERLNGVAFVDATRGWAVGENGAILATVDGGATWSAQRSGTGAGLSAVTFRGASSALAVGSAGAILATTSGE